MAARLVKQQVLPKEDLLLFFFFFFFLKKRPQKSGVADRAGKDYRKKMVGGREDGVVSGNSFSGALASH